MFPLCADPVVFGEPGEIPLQVTLLRTAKIRCFLLPFVLLQRETETLKKPVGTRAAAEQTEPLPHRPQLSFGPTQLSHQSAQVTCDARLTKGEEQVDYRGN